MLHSIEVKLTNAHRFMSVTCDDTENCGYGMNDLLRMPLLAMVAIVTVSYDMTVIIINI